MISPQSIQIATHKWSVAKFESQRVNQKESYDEYKKEYSKHVILNTERFGTGVLGSNRITIGCFSVMGTPQVDPTKILIPRKFPELSKKTTNIKSTIEEKKAMSKETADKLRLQQDKYLQQDRQSTSLNLSHSGEARRQASA